MESSKDEEVLINGQGTREGVLGTQSESVVFAKPPAPGYAWHSRSGKGLLGGHLGFEAAQHPSPSGNGTLAFLRGTNCSIAQS